VGFVSFVVHGSELSWASGSNAFGLYVVNVILVNIREVQEGSANIEYRDLEPNRLFYLELLRSAFVVRVVDLNVKSIIIICSDRGPSRVVNIDSDIVRGPELS